MKPAIRTQVDDLGDAYSDATAITFDPTEDKARQEFEQETDANRILARFGVEVPGQRPPFYGEGDYDLDLHSAMIATKEAQLMHGTLPANLREKYPTWQSLLNALSSGELKLDLTTNAPVQATDQQDVPGSSPAGDSNNPA